MLKRIFGCLVVSCLLAFGQGGTKIVDGQGTEVLFDSNGTSVIGYDGSDNVIYVCNAKSVDGDRLAATVLVSGISKATAAVVTSTAHGLPIGSRPRVTISGATGTGWVTGINGTWTATVTGADTFTVPVNSTGFDTLAGTVVFATTAPRLGVAEWRVKVFGLTGTNTTLIAWMNGTQEMNQKCSDAALSTTNVQ
jgi:hypothetical protein